MPLFVHLIAQALSIFTNHMYCFLFMQKTACHYIANTKIVIFKFCVHDFFCLFLGVTQHKVDFEDESEETAPMEDVIDVTIPLQCLVKNSKLILQQSSKVYHIFI